MNLQAIIWSVLNRHKNKKARIHSGIRAFDLFDFDLVEPERIELSSREENAVPSTCLVDFDCRVWQGRQQPNYTLVTVS